MPVQEADIQAELAQLLEENPEEAEALLTQLAEEGHPEVLALLQQFSEEGGQEEPVQNANVSYADDPGMSEARGQIRSRLDKEMAGQPKPGYEEWASCLDHLLDGAADQEGGPTQYDADLIQEVGMSVVKNIALNG